MRILGIIRAGDACSYYRVERPFANLDPAQFQTEIWSIGEKGMPPVDYAATFDLCILVRAYEVKFLPFVREASRRTAIVLDYDDLDDEPGPLRDSVNALVRHCHGLSAITPELTVLHDGPHQRLSWHNAIDFTAPPYRQSRVERDPERFMLFLGVSGQATGIAGWIAPAIAKAMAHVPNLYLRVIGNSHLIAALDKVPSERVLASPLLGLDQFLHEIGGADVLLYPNPTWDHPWGRSALRVIQAGAWGVPAIATPFPSVRRFAEQSGGGVVVVGPNNPEAWFAALISLATVDPETLRGYGVRAKACVESSYSQTAVNEQILPFWRRCAAIARAERGL